MKINRYLDFRYMNRIEKRDIDDFAEKFPLAEILKGSKFVITGATGLLGACMVNCLLALDKKYSLGLHVTSVVRNKEKALRLFGDETVNHDFYVYDFASSELFNPCDEADYIVHFASPTASKYFLERPVETILTGISGTEKVLEYASSHSVMSMAYISSLEVYGTVYDDTTPLTEDQQGYINPIDARSSYPIGKRAAECLCHAYAVEKKLPVRIARLAQTFGAGVSKDDNRVFAQFARSIISGSDITLHTTGELSRCYCYTIDAINSILYILLKGKDGEAYNVANEDTYISIIEMARYLCREFNPNVKPIIELKDGMGYSPVTKLRLSTDKIRSLGWTPLYSMHNMFANLIESLRAD